MSQMIFYSLLLHFFPLLFVMYSSNQRELCTSHIHLHTWKLGLGCDLHYAVPAITNKVQYAFYSLANHTISLSTFPLSPAAVTKWIACQCIWEKDECVRYGDSGTWKWMTPHPCAEAKEAGVDRQKLMMCHVYVFPCTLLLCVCPYALNGICRIDWYELGNQKSLSLTYWHSF